MTVLVLSNGDHEMENSAMAAEPRVAAGVQQEPSLPINLEKILSANTMKEWWSLLRASVGPELSQLHRDILSFCKAYELTAHQMQLRRDALACVERAVHEIWPSAEVHLFGSIATGLALPWSDIDVAIIPPKQDLSFRKPTPIQWQNALTRKLNRLGQCRSLKKVPFAKVPLLKVVFNSGIACDISFDVRDIHAGVAVIRQFMKQYEAFRPLCLVLKFFLGQNNLNELHTGGLRSFCIITMVISHLQKMASIVEAERRDLGTLLLSFFAHYGNMHNYSTDVVSTRADSRSSSKLDKGWVNMKKPQLLAVEDPLDPTSDIGKGSHRIAQVRVKFLQAQRTLFTHWYNKHVLVQILDMTANPTQRPAPSPSSEKSKKSKRGGKRKRCSASGQDDGILTYQPALKIRQKLHHPQQGSGLVTKSQLDFILANNGCPHLISGLRPVGKRLRTGGLDEDKFLSVQPNIAPKTPSQEARDSLRRTQANAALEADSSLIGQPRKSSLRHQTSAEEDCRSVQTIHSQLSQEGLRVLGLRVNPAQCGDLSRGRQDGSKGSNSLEASNLKSRKSLKHQPTKEDCRPIQSTAHSHLRHDGMDAAGSQENQDEKINFEFWESQLTTRSKAKRTSLQQRENSAQFRDLSGGQDGSTTRSDHLETTDSTPVVNPRNSPNDQASDEDCCRPMQAAANSHPLQGLGAERIRGSRDERLLVDFWESHLTTRPIPRKPSLEQSGTVGNDRPAQAVQTLSERPRTCSKIQSTSQDDRSPQLSGTARTNKHGQVVHSIDLGRSREGSKTQRKAQEEVSAELYRKRLQNGSKMQAKRPEEQSVKHRGTEGHNNGNTEAVQVIHQPESPQKGSKVYPTSQDEKSVEHCGSGGNQEHGHAVQPIHPEEPQKGSRIQPKSEDEKSVERSAGIGSNSEHAQTTHPERPQTGSTTEPKSQNAKLVVDLDFWEAQLTTKRKSRSTSLIHQICSRGGVGKDPQPAVAIHSKPPAAEGKDDAVGEFQGDGTLVELSEPHLTKTQRSRSGPLQHGIKDKTDPSEHTIQHEQPPQGRDLHDSRNVPDVGILIDFWEAQLAPRLKSQRGVVEDSPRPLKSAKGVSRVRTVEVNDPDQLQNHKDVMGTSGDDRILVEFWEAQLAPRLKASKCSSKHHPAGCEEEDTHAVQQSHPDQPQHETDVKDRRSGDERILLEFWEAQLAPGLKAIKCPSNLPAAGCGEEDEQREQKSQLRIISQDERKLVDFWETHLNSKPKLRKGLLNDQQRAAGGAVEEGDAEKGNDHGYDRILAEFWEAHLTPNLKSRKGPLKPDVIECEEDIRPVEKTHHRELPTQQGSGFVGRSGDEVILSTFWEVCLNPAISRKGYLRRNATEII